MISQYEFPPVESSNKLLAASLNWPVSQIQCSLDGGPNTGGVMTSTQLTSLRRSKEDIEKQRLRALEIRAKKMTEALKNKASGRVPQKRPEKGRN